MSAILFLMALATFIASQMWRDGGPSGEQAAYFFALTALIAAVWELESTVKDKRGPWSP